MARAPLLQLSEISLTYGGDPIFEGLSLNVQPGDRVALVGRNGSGKSTLMKVMAGFVEPDRGEVVLAAGVSTGYMEQDPDLSGFETLGEFARDGLEPGEDYLVDMAAEGLKFDPDRPVDTASGGERRRAALARLLARAPELMLLDEPTNHLDIRHQLAILDLVGGLGLTTVIALHDLNQAMRCDRLAVMQAGRLVALGPPDRILTADLLARVFQVRASTLTDPQDGSRVMRFHPVV